MCINLQKCFSCRLSLCLSEFILFSPEIFNFVTKCLNNRKSLAVIIDYPFDIFKLLSVLLRTRMVQRLRELEYLTTHTSLSPIRCGFAPALYITKRCARLAFASDKDYQLLAHGLWFSTETKDEKIIDGP
jgi:hypothetical protein